MNKFQIRNENFYTVLGWMLNVLELKGNELIIFAIIYSFSQDGESEFNGSLTYLQNFSNIKSQNTVMATLKSLTDKNYIIKREYMKNNVKRVAYRANLEFIDKCKGALSSITPDNHLKNWGTAKIEVPQKMRYPTAKIEVLPLQKLRVIYKYIFIGI